MFTSLIYSEAAAPGEGTSGCLKMVAHLIEVLFSVVLTIMSAGSISSLASKLMESGCSIEFQKVEETVFLKMRVEIRGRLTLRFDFQGAKRLSTVSKGL